MNSLHFSSASHDVLNQDGTPKIVTYRVAVFPANDSSGVPPFDYTFDKALAISRGDGTFDMDVLPLLNLVPADFAGYLFVRGEGVHGNGAYGAGVAFLKVTPPAVCNAIALS